MVNFYKCENFQILQLQNSNRFVSDYCILPSERNQTSPTCLPRSELGSLLNRSAAPHNLLLFINNIYILGGKLLIHFIKLLPVHSVFVVFCTYKNLHTCNSQASEKRRKWRMKILYFFIGEFFTTSIYESQSSRYDLRVSVLHAWYTWSDTNIT